MKKFAIPVLAALMVPAAALAGGEWDESLDRPAPPVAKHKVCEVEQVESVRVRPAIPVRTYYTSDYRVAPVVPVATRATRLVIPSRSYLDLGYNPSYSGILARNAGFSYDTVIVDPVIY